MPHRRNTELGRVWGQVGCDTVLVVLVVGVLVVLVDGWVVWVCVDTVVVCAVPHP